MDILKVEYPYFPWPVPTLWSGNATNFMFDMPKLNMLYLVHPELDALRSTPWRGDRYTEAINGHLGRETRRALQGPPRVFLDHWEELRATYILPMEKHWPEHYMDTVRRKVRDVELRLRAEMPAGVVRVDFQRKVKVA